MRKPSKKGITYPDRPGWVYFIRVVGGPTKIGMTLGDPFDRMLQVDRGVPYPVEAVGFMWSENVGILEDDLHTAFDAYWLKGEWFDLTDKQLVALRRHPSFKTPEATSQFLHESRLAQVRAVQSRESEQFPPLNLDVSLYELPELPPWRGPKRK